MLCYDVRESEPPGRAVLLLIGSPMGAAGFGTLKNGARDDLMLGSVGVGSGSAGRLRDILAGDG